MSAFSVTFCCAEELIFMLTVENSSLTSPLSPPSPVSPTLLLTVTFIDLAKFVLALDDL